MRASLVSLVATLALPQTVFAGDNDDDGYFSMFPSGPVLGDLLPWSGAKSEDSKAAKEPKKPIVAPEDAYVFGPKNCVKTWLVQDTNRCMMQTDCKEADIKDYMFHLICVDRGGEKAKHTFGVGSFEPQETFDTLLTCQMCSGEKVIDTQLAAKQVDLDAVNRKEDPAKAVQELVGAVREMKEEMKDATAAIKKLNAQVFSDDEGTQVPAAVAAAEAPPGKFVAEAIRPRDEDGRLPEMTRFLAHRTSAEALKVAAEAGRENMAMHRAAIGLDSELRGGLNDWSGTHSSKLQRIKRERSAKHHVEAEHEAVTMEAKRHEAVAAKLKAKVEDKQTHEHHDKHHEKHRKKHHEKAHVEVQQQAVADAQDEQSTDAQAESDSQDQSDGASQDTAEGESEQGADAQDGEETVEDALQEGAAEEGDEQQQDSGTEAEEADASQDEGSAQEPEPLNMRQQQESGAEAQDADASQDEGSAQTSDQQAQDSPVQVTQAEAQDQEDTAQQTDQSAEGDEQADVQETDSQAQDDEPPSHGEYEAALLQAPKVRGSRHRAMLLQQSDSVRVAEAPEPTAEYDMSDAFQAEQKHKADLALN